MYTNPAECSIIGVRKGIPLSNPASGAGLIPSGRFGYLYELKSMKKNKGVVVSFRLTEEEFKPFKELLDKSDKTKSEFFRDIFLAKEKNINITFNELKPIDYYSILRVVNKSGNNLNQIAKSFNSANKSNVISERVYLKGLNLLISINTHLKRALNDS